MQFVLHVKRFPKILQEIHLSHNEIGHRGVAMLLAVLAMHPKEAYPRSVEHLDEAKLPKANEKD